VFNIGALTLPTEIGPEIEKYGLRILTWAKTGSSWTWSWVYCGTL